MSQSHHVLHVIDSLGRSGGSERQLVVNLQAFSDSRLTHSVAVIHEGPDSRRNEVPDDIPVEILFEGRSRVAPVHRTLPRLLSLVRSLRPSVIHGSLAVASQSARIVGALTRTAVLESLVNIAYEPIRTVDSAQVTPLKLNLHRLRDRLTIGAVTRFHAVSQTVAHSWQTNLGIDATAITVIPRGLVPHALPGREQARRAVLRDLQLPPDAFVILNVGRQEPQKGQRYAIEAMPTIVHTIPGAVLLIAGREGTASLSLKSTIEDTDTHQLVRLLGSRDDIASLLAASDVFVFPSLYEGSGGNALLEAMGAGLPIVSVNRPPMTELARHEQEALMVNPQSPPELAAAVIRLAQDEPLRRRLGHRAADRANSRFDPIDAARRLETLYIELANARSMTETL